MNKNTVRKPALYLGCFQERPDAPDLAGQAPLTISTLEACITHCSIGAWTYAAIRNGTICTCGDRCMQYGAVASTFCSSECPEGSGQCGGPNSNSIHRVNGLQDSKLDPTPVPTYIPTHRDISNGGEHIEDSTPPYLRENPIPPPRYTRSPAQTTHFSPPSVDPNHHSEYTKGEEGHNGNHTMVISSCVLGMALVVVAVAMFVMYRARKNRKIPVGKSKGSTGRGAEEGGCYVVPTNGRGAFEGMIVQEWYPGMMSMEPGKEDEYGLKRKSSMESTLFEGFDSSKHSLPDMLRPTASASLGAAVVDGSSRSSSPVLGHGNRRVMHYSTELTAPSSSATVFAHKVYSSKLAAPSSPSSHANTSSLQPHTPNPTYPAPALCPFVSPISPTLRSTPFASSSRHPIQTYTGSPDLPMESLRLNSSMSSSQPQQQRRSQLIKEIILRGDDDYAHRRTLDD